MSKICFIVICTLLFCSTEAQHKIYHVFNLGKSPAIIEGMTYDPVDKYFYFGESISRKILRYTFSGKPAGHIDCGKDGMISILGSAVDPRNHHLWVCGAIDTGNKKRMCMFLYDLENGSLMQKLADTSGRAKLFNDVTITANGSVFVTDTDTHAVYKADNSNNVMTEYLRSDLLKDANGIASNNDTLYVSTSRGIVRINTINKEISSLPLADFMIAGIDGLYYYNNSVIGIQNVFYPVTIIRYYLDNDHNKLSKAEVLACGDVSFVIPTTGAITGDDFYFMSNNNIANEEFLKTKKGIPKPVTIEKIPLKY
jgi:hypothetical protein